MKSAHGVFSSLPAGSVSPRGWLHDWAKINAEGWLLDYARQRDPRVYGRLWNRVTTAEIRMSANGEWLDPPDYNAYFADGLVRYAHLFPDSEIARCADEWIEKALASQDEDGYIGAYVPEARWKNWLEIFAQSVVLEALLFRYETKGDPRILEAVERCARRQIDAWSAPGVERKIFSTHGTITVRLMTALHRCTGNGLYLDFAREVLGTFGKTRTYLAAAQKAWYTPAGDALVGEHVVMETEHVGFPALLYERTGAPELLAASRAAWAMMERHHLSVAGTPNGNEAMFRVGPRESSEHCAAVEWIITAAALARITGESRFADAAERCYYNAYPAAKSPDALTVAYMHAPNQLTAAEWGSSTFYDNIEACCRQHYHSAQDPLCCNANSPRGIPWFLDSMIMRAGGGVAVVLYGPCAARALLADGTRTGVEVRTAYPFEDDIRVTLTPESPKDFPLLLRIPSWAGAYTVTVNGAPAACSLAGGYAKIARTWKPGDTVHLHMAPEIVTEDLRRSEFGIRAPGIAFRRGPLTYCLPVAETWTAFTPPGSAAVQEAEYVRAFRVLPSQDAAWNYAVAKGPVTITRREIPADALPWTNPPLGLRVKGRRVLSWRLDGEPDHPMTPGLPYQPMQLAEGLEDVTLVPYGFTHLRLTYLPRLDDAGTR